MFRSIWLDSEPRGRHEDDPSVFKTPRSHSAARCCNGAAAVNIDQLEGLILAVEDYNEEIGDVDMEFDIALLRQLIDVLEANGANPPPPTWEPAPDPWPAD